MLFPKSILDPDTAADACASDNVVDTIIRLIFAGTSAAYSNISGENAGENDTLLVCPLIETDDTTIPDNLLSPDLVVVSSIFMVAFAFVRFNSTFSGFVSSIAFNCVLSAIFISVEPAVFNEKLKFTVIA